MSRGVEVRGSEHFCLRTLRKLECAQDPGVPRALGTFEASGLPAIARSATAGQETGDGLPGAAKNTGGGALAV